MRSIFRQMSRFGRFRECKDPAFVDQQGIGLVVDEVKIAKVV